MKRQTQLQISQKPTSQYKGKIQNMEDEEDMKMNSTDRGMWKWRRIKPEKKFNYRDWFNVKIKWKMNMYDGYVGELNLELGFFVHISQFIPIYIVFWIITFKLYCLINNNGLMMWKITFFKNATSTHCLPYHRFWRAKMRVGAKLQQK